MSLLNLERMTGLLPRDKDSGFFDIDIALIGLRLLYHAQSTGATVPSSEDGFLACCEESLADVLFRAAKKEFSATSDVLQTDPVSLISGILCMRDIALRERCIARYANLIGVLDAKRINPVSSKSAPILAAFLNGLNNDPFSTYFKHMTHTTTAFSDDINPKGLFEVVMSLTSFGTEKANNMIEHLSIVVRPLALSAVHQKNIVELSMVMIAAELTGYGSLLEPEYKQWLMRMQNEDGLFGSWELDGATTPRALLLTTMYAFCALHCLGGSRPPFVPGMKPFAQVSPKSKCSQLDRVEISPQALSDRSFQLCKWIDKNFYRFLIDLDTQDREQINDRIKPAVELSLTFFLIQSSCSKLDANPLAQWARDRARDLYELMPWRGMIEFFRVNLSASLGLLLFPLLSIASSRPIPYEEDVKAILSNPYSLAQERPPMRKMDFCFLTRLMGLKLDTIPEIMAQFRETLLSRNVHPLWFSTSSQYDITHTIFYATDFGNANDVDHYFPSNWIRTHLLDLAFKSIVQRDLDLGGEFLLCAFYAGLEAHPLLMPTIRAFLGTLPDEGPVEGPNPEFHANLDEFDSCYHTTLVVIATLAKLSQYQQDVRQSSDEPEKTRDWPVVTQPPPEYNSLITEGELGEFCRKYCNLQGVHAQHMRSHRGKHTFRIRDKNSVDLILNCYQKKTDWPTVLGTLNLQQLAAEKKLGPQFFRSHNESTKVWSDKLWVMRNFVTGMPLCETEGLRRYSIIGAFAAHFHKELGNGTLVGLQNHTINWAECLNCDLAENVPPQIVNLVVTPKPENAKIIHGDLNSTNLIISVGFDHVCAIDFDNSGIGFPEQELALSLLYENRGIRQFQQARANIIESYKSQGGALNRELLDAYIVTAPIYAYVSGVQKKSKGMLPGLNLKAACLSQLNDRMAAVLDC